MNKINSKVIKCLFVDAMGVLYKSADDVDELLIPFCRKNGSGVEDNEIRDIYVEFSLGRISSHEFWKRVGIQEDLDEDYIRGHKLNNGVLETLASLHEKGFHLYCLSNDVAEWSALLRKRFLLDRFFGGWIISGEVGVRKPDPKIYDIAWKKSGFNADQCLFIDDREKNLRAALEKGMGVLKFGRDNLSEKVENPFVESFGEIEVFVTNK
ncbi:MAG TPA: HAD-IA family hydrolase [bacterium]